MSASVAPQIGDEQIVSKEIVEGEGLITWYGCTGVYGRFNFRIISIFDEQGDAFVNGEIWFAINKSTLNKLFETRVRLVRHTDAQEKRLKITEQVKDAVEAWFLANIYYPIKACDYSEPIA